MVFLHKLEAELRDGGGYHYLEFRKNSVDVLIHNGAERVSPNLRIKPLICMCWRCVMTDGRLGAVA
jgi:hypothetical protein